MTAKQKAKSIVDEFWKIYPKYKLGSGDKDFSTAVTCAIAVCNLLVKEYYDVHYETDGHYDYKDVRDYWQNVKEQVHQIELNNLKNV